MLTGKESCSKIQRYSSLNRDAKQGRTSDVTKKQETNSTLSYACQTAW